MALGLGDLRSGKTTFGDLAYKAVLNAILTHKLNPGDSLRSKELAAALGISRTPVDRALERLAGEGLVEFKPGLGPHVFSPTVEEMLELYDIRSMLEVHSVLHGIALVDDQYLRRMEALLEEHETAFAAIGSDQDSRRRSSEADRLIHEHIVSLWPSRRIQTWYRQLNVHVKAFLLNKVPTYRREAAPAEHRAIYEALLARDVAAAAEAVARHGAGSKGSFLSKVQADSASVGARTGPSFPSAGWERLASLSSALGDTGDSMPGGSS
ncbi:MAG: GntR family transcriptional regulator [Chloroflexi bacterium]|nr:GntR family transcriptional regulator [Chloroflexota bacterium]MCL5026205.1 GntR family transcriptional regulator [Chloroflexota bacterium]